MARRKRGSKRREIERGSGKILQWSRGEGRGDVVVSGSLLTPRGGSGPHPSPRDPEYPLLRGHDKSSDQSRANINTHTHTHT